MKLRRSNITLPLLLQRQIELDEHKDLNELIKREREIGKKNKGLSKKKQLFNWLDSLASEDLVNYQAKLLKGNFLIKLFLSFAGFMSGAFTIYGLSNYREKIPTNLILLLGLFFLFQLISVLFFFFASNYSLSSLLTKVTPESWKGLLNKNNAVFAHLKKKFSIYLSQVFSIAFFTGAIFTFLTLVVVTDLAFSWSSSLDITSKKVHSITSTISTPWQSVVTNAVPSEQLVKNSRYYKLQDKLEKFEAKIYGYWWPFVAMCLLVYGLIPRLITYIYSLLSLNKTITKTCLVIPGIEDVLDRMNSKVVSLSSTKGSSRQIETLDKSTETRHTEQNTEQRKEGLKFEQLALKENTEVLIWSEATGSNFFEAHSELITKYHTIGSQRSTAQDKEVINELNKQNNILILTKSWEPPKAEFTDFLILLRQHLGNTKVISVLPIALANKEGKKEIKDIHAQAWSLALAKLNDSWIRLYKE